MVKIHWFHVFRKRELTDDAGRLTGDMLQVVVVWQGQFSVAAIMKSYGIADILRDFESFKNNGADFTMAHA